MLGGLARRATYIKTWKQSAKSPVLNLAGAYEYSYYPDQARVPAGRLRFLAKAYDLMGYDAQLVSLHERGLLDKAGVKPRPWWRGGGRLDSQVFKLGKAPHAVNVGVLYLNHLPDNQATLPSGAVQNVAEAVKDLRLKADVVVALSDWGYQRERALLSSAEPMPDILLGSGPGIGLTGMNMQAGRVLWIRSFAEGKGMQRIELLRLPERNSTFAWTEGQNIRMNLDGLTDQYADDRRVLDLLRTTSTD